MEKPAADSRFATPPVFHQVGDLSTVRGLLTFLGFWPLDAADRKEAATAVQTFLNDNTWLLANTKLVTELQAQELYH